MECFRGLVAAVKPIHPGVGAAEERQKCTTRERSEHQPAGGSAVGAGLQPGQAKEVWREPRRSAPQPLGRRCAEASYPANCSHFCSHLVNFPPENPVVAWLFKPTTANLLSSRSCVRITQGALSENRSHAGVWLSQGKQSQGRARPRSSRRRLETVIGCLDFKRMSRSGKSGRPYAAVAHRSVLPVQAGIARGAPAAPF